MCSSRTGFSFSLDEKETKNQGYLKFVPATMLHSHSVIQGLQPYNPLALD